MTQNGNRLIIHWNWLEFELEGFYSVINWARSTNTLILPVTSISNTVRARNMRFFQFFSQNKIFCCRENICSKTNFPKTSLVFHWNGIQFIVTGSNRSPHQNSFQHVVTKCSRESEEIFKNGFVHIETGSRQAETYVDTERKNFFDSSSCCRLNLEATDRKLFWNR